MTISDEESDHDYYKRQAAYWQSGAAMHHRHYVKRLADYNFWPTAQGKELCDESLRRRRIASGTAMDYLEWVMRTKP